VLVSIGRIADLTAIERRDGRLCLGAAVTATMLLDSAAVRESAHPLALAAEAFGAPAVRDMATLGGNVATASPAGDLSTALLALDATAVLIGPRGERRALVGELFAGPRRSAIAPDELLVEFQVPAGNGRCGGDFVKLGPRQALAISVVCAAASITLAEGGTCAEARIALGSVAPTPLRARAAESLLRGQRPEGSLLARAAERAAAEASPISDVRGSAWYRRRVTPAIVRRALETAAARAAGGR
jgi:CO/xanthine dehydrogenase FAD-binding subunit